MFGTRGKNENTAYWVTGVSQSETVVLIHGFNSSHLTWAQVVPELAKRYRVVTLDQPGHGESVALSSDFTPKAMAKNLNRIFEELRLEKAHLVGHSMGGRTAVAFASLYPEKVQTLSVADMHLMPVPQAKAQLAKLLQTYDAIRVGLKNEFASFEEASTALSRWYTAEEIKFILFMAIRQPNGSLRLGNRPEATNLYLNAGLSEDLGDLLVKIPAPTAFYSGDPADQTTVLRAEGIAKIKKARPDVAIFEISGAGHSVQRAPLFTEKLLRFLRPSK